MRGSVTARQTQQGHRHFKTVDDVELPAHFLLHLWKMRTTCSDPDYPNNSGKETARPSIVSKLPGESGDVSSEIGKSRNTIASAD
jgi:hypothetical protein